MSRFASIDLSRLPAPDAVEPLDFETILAERKAALRGRLDAAGLLPDWNPDSESDPLVKLLEEASYRELLLRQRINDGVRAVMLATATGTTLDVLAANFSTSRQIVEAGDPKAVPPRPPVHETDARLRSRVQLAFEALSTAGPEGAYVYHALNADPRVSDVAVTSPQPGHVILTILSSEGDGTPSSSLLFTVDASMRGRSGDGVRPFTDCLQVQAGTKLEYSVEAALDLYDGPDSEVVRAASEASVTAFTRVQRRLGEPVTLDGLYKALRVDGVRKVHLSKPSADLEPGETGWAQCTGIRVVRQGGGHGE